MAGTLTEIASRKVLMSPELMAEWTSSRTTDGYLLTWDWGEPNAEGFYTPAVTVHSDDWIGELDTAWREAEAALPEGWAINLLWGTVTSERWGASAGPWPSNSGDPHAYAGGPTPAAALHALTAALQARFVR